MKKSAGRIRWIGMVIAVGIVVGITIAIIYRQRSSSPFNDLYSQPDPYPAFIYEVQPEPGSAFSLSDLDDNSLYYNQTLYFTDDICVVILELPLLRPNDDLYEYENIQLTLNNKAVNVEPYHEPTDRYEMLVDEDGNFIAAGAYSDLVCWDEKLSPGKHIAEVLVWTSTGEEFTYRWAFWVIR